MAHSLYQRSVFDLLFFLVQIYIWYFNYVRICFHKNRRKSKIQKARMFEPGKKVRALILTHSDCESPRTDYFADSRKLLVLRICADSRKFADKNKLFKENLRTFTHLYKQFQKNLGTFTNFYKTLQIATNNLANLYKF